MSTTACCVAQAHSRTALVNGVTEAGTLLRRRNPLLICGIVGYWAWDNLALWATFHAIGYAPGASVILLAYLIGQLGAGVDVLGVLAEDDHRPLFRGA